MNGIGGINQDLFLKLLPSLFTITLVLAAIIGSIMFIMTIYQWYNMVQRNETAGRAGYIIRRVIVSILLTMPVMLIDQLGADILTGGKDLATSMIDITSNTSGLTNGQMMVRVILVYFQLLGLFAFLKGLYDAGNMGNPDMGGQAPQGQSVMWKIAGGLVLINVVPVSEVIFFAFNSNPIKDAAGI